MLKAELLWKEIHSKEIKGVRIEATKDITDAFNFAQVVGTANRADLAASQTQMLSAISVIRQGDANLHGGSNHQQQLGGATGGLNVMCGFNPMGGDPMGAMGGFNHMGSMSGFNAMAGAMSGYPMGSMSGFNHMGGFNPMMGGGFNHMGGGFNPMMGAMGGFNQHQNRNNQQANNPEQQKLLQSVSNA